MDAVRWIHRAAGAAAFIAVALPAACTGDAPTAPLPVPPVDAPRTTLTAAAETSPFAFCDPDVFDSLINDPPQTDGPSVPAFDERWECIMSPAALGRLTVSSARVDGRNCSDPGPPLDPDTPGCGTLTFTFTPAIPECAGADDTGCYTGFFWETSTTGLRYPPGYWFFTDWVHEETPPIFIGHTSSLPPCTDTIGGHVESRPECEMAVFRNLSLDEWTRSRFPSDGWVEFRAVEMHYRPTTPDANPVVAFAVPLHVLGPNKPPRADFSYAFTATPREVVFTSHTFDPEFGDLAITWDFGDGHAGGGAVVTHRYDEPGTYEVTLTVTDPQGATATHAETVTIDTPLAVIRTQATGTPLERIFDGQDSRPSSGGTAITSWAWDLGDGATSAEPTFLHTYRVACTYPVTLTVTDDAGGVDTRTEPVQIGDSPQAAFDYTLVPGEPLTVDFDASASFDALGAGLTYAWDFDDGSPPLEAGPFPRFTFPHAGVWNVTLTITDGGGCEVATTRRVDLNRKPVASFDWVQSDVLFVHFDASGSHDPDGGVLTYDWDFGDDSAHGAGAAPDHGYPDVGDYPVTLTVTDDEGDTGELTRTVHVGEAVLEAEEVGTPATRSRGSLEVDPGTRVRYLGSGWSPSGGPIVVTRNGEPLETFSAASSFQGDLVVTYDESDDKDFACQTDLVATQGQRVVPLTFAVPVAEEVVIARNVDVTARDRDSDVTVEGSGTFLRQAHDGTFLCRGEETTDPITTGGVLITRSFTRGSQGFDSPGTPYPGLWITALDDHRSIEVKGGLFGRTILDIGGERIEAFVDCSVAGLTDCSDDQIAKLSPVGKVPFVTISDRASEFGAPFTGFNFSPSPRLTINTGDLLRLEDGLLYASGNVFVTGGVEGKGAVISPGSIVVGGNVDLSSEFESGVSFMTGRGVLFTDFAPGLAPLLNDAHFRDTLLDAPGLGFAPGDEITINPGGPNEETAVIDHLGSLDLTAPLEFDHQAGESIVRVPLRERLEALRAALSSLDSGTRKHAGHRLAKAADALGKALDPALWTDPDHLDPEHGPKVFEGLKHAATELAHLKSPGDGAADALTEALAIGRALAEHAVAEAQEELDAGGGDPHARRELDHAREELERAARDLDRHPEHVIDRYRQAWDHAVKAVKHL